jgi:hypothetical protein
MRKILTRRTSTGNGRCRDHRRRHHRRGHGLLALRAGMSTVLVEMRDGLSTLTTTASIESFRPRFYRAGHGRPGQRVH